MSEIGAGTNLWTVEALSALSKTELQALALQVGLKKAGVGWPKCCPPKGSKADIAHTLDIGFRSGALVPTGRAANAIVPAFGTPRKERNGATHLSLKKRPGMVVTSSNSSNSSSTTTTMVSLSSSSSSLPAAQSKVLPPCDTALVNKKNSVCTTEPQKQQQKQKRQQQQQQQQQQYPKQHQQERKVIQKAAHDIFELIAFAGTALDVSDKGVFELGGIPPEGVYTAKPNTSVRHFIASRGALNPTPGTFASAAIFSLLPAMSTLVLDENALQALPSDLGHHLPSLRTLDLRGNMLTCLPASITKLVYLRELLLDHNALTALPNNLGVIHLLEILQLDDNKLKSLPASLGDMHCLQVLSVRHNPLRSLPATLGCLAADSHGSRNSSFHLKLQIDADNDLVNVPQSIIGDSCAILEHLAGLLRSASLKAAPASNTTTTVGTNIVTNAVTIAASAVTATSNTTSSAQEPSGSNGGGASSLLSSENDETLMNGLIAKTKGLAIKPKSYISKSATSHHPSQAQGSRSVSVPRKQSATGTSNTATAAGASAHRGKLLYAVTDTNQWVERNAQAALMSLIKRHRHNVSVVLPLACMRELEGLKLRKDGVGVLARESIRFVRDCLAVSPPLIRPQLYNETRLAGDQWHQLSSDHKIMDCAYHIKKVLEEQGDAGSFSTVLLSEDVALQAAALAYKVPVSDAPTLLMASVRGLPLENLPLPRPRQHAFHSSSSQSASNFCSGDSLLQHRDGSLKMKNPLVQKQWTGYRSRSAQTISTSSNPHGTARDHHHHKQYRGDHSIRSQDNPHRAAVTSCL